MCPKLNSFQISKLRDSKDLKFQNVITWKFHNFKSLTLQGFKIFEFPESRLFIISNFNETEFHVPKFQTWWYTQFQLLQWCCSWDLQNIIYIILSIYICLFVCLEFCLDLLYFWRFMQHIRGPRSDVWSTFGKFQKMSKIILESIPKPELIILNHSKLI